MSVKKRASSVDSFIYKGAEVKSSKEKITFKNILVRIPDCVLSELDNLLEKKPWLNRTQWIVESINDKIKRESLNEKKENLGI